MTFATPQLIPKKKESGGQGLANWRQSPGLKPATSPKPMPIDAPSLPSPNDSANYEDHIVHISVSKATRADIDRVLLPACGYATTYAYGYLLHIAPSTTVPLERENADPFDKVELTGPAAHFKTPKPELITTGQQPHSDSTPDAPPAAPVNKHGLPEMELPPAADTPTTPQPTGSNEELFIAVYGTQDAAENAKHLIRGAYPRSTVTITTRKRGTTNSTLVIKGVPFQTRVDSLIDSLAGHLTCKPSYVRLHRSERGVFKCVIFFKFSTRVQAEHAKYELERITVGSRPLRVEFKTRRESQSDAPTSSAPSAPASLNTLPPAYGASKAPPLLGPSSPPVQQTVSTMEQTLSAIALGDYDGCVYTSSELKNEDIRYLAHLCIVSCLQLIPATPSNVPSEANISLATITASSTPEYLLIRKRPPPPPTSSGGSGGIFDRNSPQFQPSSTPKFTPRVVPTTPQWTAHTPSSLQPMDFRGIRHWKEVRQEATSESTGNTGAALGIIRPMGPESGTPFGAGRGRPAR
eukprot:GILI01017932.1.p1 GENE.GILI01017932.1~~GILI01017932.1.p1  ORF type:complete len:534 (-),score=70.70 GILI01017932.1:118-1683(-)